MQFKLPRNKGSTVRVQLLHDVPHTRCDYKITNAADVDRLVGDSLRQQDRENLLVIYLNSRRQVIDIEVAAIGTLTDMCAAPREVFKGAILANACEIIIVHNHPSGDITPSDADERVMYEMIAAGRMLKIPVRDFVIIGNGYFSHYECQTQCASSRAHRAKRFAPCAWRFANHTVITSSSCCSQPFLIPNDSICPAQDWHNR